MQMQYRASAVDKTKIEPAMSFLQKKKKQIFLHFLKLQNGWEVVKMQGAHKKI